MLHRATATAAVRRASQKSGVQVIRSLFARGEKGVWFDPSDLSTMFQDSAGTTPVTAAGQPVGRIVDKSGNGVAATQGTAGSRPVLRQDASGKYYLEFDGTDDWLATSAIDFSATDEMFIGIGIQKAAYGAIAIALELSANTNSNSGSFFVACPITVSGVNAQVKVSGTTPTGNALTAVLPAAPAPFVLTARIDISANSNTININGTNTPSNGQSTGGGNFGNHALYIGRRGGSTLPFVGAIYQIVVCGGSVTALNTSRAERYLSAVTL